MDSQGPISKYNQLLASSKFLFVVCSFYPLQICIHARID
jgi:hypothetical protein